MYNISVKPYDKMKNLSSVTMTTPVKEASIRLYLKGFDVVGMGKFRGIALDSKEQIFLGSSAFYNLVNMADVEFYPFSISPAGTLRFQFQDSNLNPWLIEFEGDDVSVVLDYADPWVQKEKTVQDVIDAGVNWDFIEWVHSMYKEVVSHNSETA